MKDLKEKIKRKISEMLDADGLTAEELNFLTEATCTLAEDDRRKGLSALPMLAAGAAFGKKPDNDEE